MKIVFNSIGETQEYNNIGLQLISETEIRVVNTNKLIVLPVSILGAYLDVKEKNAEIEITCAM